MNNDVYKSKYIKYKAKYLELKDKKGGMNSLYKSNTMENEKLYDKKYLNLYSKKMVQQPITQSKKKPPIKISLSSDDNLDSYLTNNVIKLFKNKFKIDLNLELGKKIYGIFQKKPKLIISTADLLFMNLDELTNKFLNLIVELKNYQGGARSRGLTFDYQHPEEHIGFINTFQTPIPSEDDLPSFYLREHVHMRPMDKKRSKWDNVDGPHMRIPYKYLNSSEINSCNNIFDPCDPEDTNQEYCIFSNQIENPDNRQECSNDLKCSPRDPISYENFSKLTHNHIYQYDKTKECYDGHMLNNLYNQHLEHPTTKEKFHYEHKIRIYLDTLIKQQIEKNSQKIDIRMLRLSDKIDKKIKENPIKYAIGGVISVVGIGYVPSGFSTPVKSALRLSLALVVEVMMINKFMRVKSDSRGSQMFKTELNHIIPYKIYNKIFIKMFDSLRNEGLFNFVNDLPKFPVGDVFETLKPLLD